MTRIDVRDETMAPIEREPTEDERLRAHKALLAAARELEPGFVGLALVSAVKTDGGQTLVQIELLSGVGVHKAKLEYVLVESMRTWLERYDGGRS